MDLVSVQILILQVGFLCNNLMLRFGKPLCKLTS